MSLNYTKEDPILEPAYSLHVEEYSVALHRMTDTDELVQFALDSVLALTDAHAGSLFIWDDRAKEFVAKAVRSPHGAGRSHDLRIRLREGVAGKVAEHGRSVLVTDIRHDERFSAIPRNGQYNSPSFICLPLTVENKLIGVINVTEKETRTPFTQNDWKQAELFSKHVAAAFENERMRQRLQNDNHALHLQIGELTETLKQQENLVSVGKLASNLAHELTNPLDAIRRFVNLALDESLEDSLTREYLLKAKRGIRRAVNVIRGLLQFSRDSVSASLKTSEVHQLIEQSIEVVSHDQRFDKIIFEKHFDHNRLYIKDGGLQLVFKNLFENSAQAMNGNGSVPQGKVILATRRENGSVIVSVQDTGKGIPENVRPRIFEPFFTTKTNGEGTGIGLAICREIVERSGGKISAESSHEEGALFQIILPCVER